MIKENPLIPQTDKNFFIFKKNNQFYSCDLYLNHQAPYNIENVYLIFMSYLKCGENLIYSIYTIAKRDEDDKIPILFYINPSKIENLSFIDFKLWFENQLERDWEYSKHYSYYGFRFIFEKHSINFNTGYIYPKYPWDVNFKKTLIKSHNYLEKDKKIQELKLKIKKLIKYIQTPRSTLYNARRRSKKF